MAFKMKSPFSKKGPCWKGYEMVGTKKKVAEKFLTVFQRKRNNLKL